MISNPIFVGKQLGRISTAAGTKKIQQAPLVESKPVIEKKTGIVAVQEKPKKTVVEQPSISREPGLGIEKPKEKEVSRERAVQIPEKRKKISKLKESAAILGEKRKKIVKLKPKNVLAKIKPLNYPYSLQVASFPDFEKAKQSITIYKDYGLQAYTVKVNLGKKGTWWRVFVGYFKSREEVMKIRMQTKLLDSYGQKNSVRQSHRCVFF